MLERRRRNVERDRIRSGNVQKQGCIRKFQEIKESRHIAERDRNSRRNVGEGITNLRKESRDIVERDRRRRSRNVGESRKMQEKKAGIIVLKENGGLDM